MGSICSWYCVFTPVEAPDKIYEFLIRCKITLVVRNISSSSKMALMLLQSAGQSLLTFQKVWFSVGTTNTRFKKRSLVFGWSGSPPSGL